MELLDQVGSWSALCHARPAQGRDDFARVEDPVTVRFDDSGSTARKLWYRDQVGVKRDWEFARLWLYAELKGGARRSGN